MYIVELFVKLKQDYKNKTGIFKPKKQKEEIEEKYTGCVHIFMPIDSTKEILACTKCGIIKKRSEIKKDKNNKNFFIKD